VATEARPAHGREHSVSLTLPPLAMVCFRCEGPSGQGANAGF
jgi:hypothetical protein